MSGEQNWRTEITAQDYFGHQKKANILADRRPVIRKPSDLVGPGIASSAIRVTDYNDTLATYNGYFSSALGALNAPNNTGSFVGYVSMDSEIGGIQVFTDMDNGSVYRRMFLRAPGDPSSIVWGEWAWSPTVTPSFIQQFVNTTTVPNGSQTSLTASNMQGVGLAGTFSTDAVSGPNLYIHRPGVYVGSVRVTGSTNNVDYELSVPDQAVDRLILFTAPTTAPYFQPVTIIKTSLGTSAINMKATQTSGAARVCGWSMELSRIGHAA